MADRKPVVAGNWKMNKTSEEAEALAKGVVDAVSGVEGVEVVVCPTFTCLERVAGVVKDTSVCLGAQNVYWEAEGAFTGEISTAMLLTAGCSHVILGHSERRQFFGETDGTVNRRVKAALEATLSPIVCVGETQEERESGVTDSVVRTQVTGSLDGLSSEEVDKLVIAYEPVWAIGTGLTATPEQADEVHALIRSVLADAHGQETADSVRIQYGGSVKPDNASVLFSQPNIDGGLIGGASLEAVSFAAVVKGALG
ncbi:MAG: triose-phosphate isomerase [Gemmatimonadetes bacterium]|nr:triose-phosphate isomerase [Gemmatimonadota bacterium]